MKRFIALILSACLCLASASALASCGCEKENTPSDTRVINTEPDDPDMTDENGFGYVVNDDGKTLTVILYQGSATEIAIPSEYSGKTVTKIDRSVFRNTDITSVSIPSSIEKIGNRAFSNCRKLVNVSIAEGLKEIDNFAFSYCSRLTSVTLPQSLTRLGEYTFTASGLVECVVPSGVTALENYVFFQCADLESVTVPSSVNTFGRGVFGEDEKLTVYGESGSPVEEYAQEQNVSFAAAE